jgi:hypothetical protein
LSISNGFHSTPRREDFVAAHELLLFRKDRFFNGPTNKVSVHFLHRVLGRKLPVPAPFRALNFYGYVEVILVFKYAERAITLVPQALQDGSFNRFAVSVGPFRDIVRDTCL